MVLVVVLLLKTAYVSRIHQGDYHGKGNYRVVLWAHCTYIVMLDGGRLLFGSPLPPNSLPRGEFVFDVL